MAAGLTRWLTEAVPKGRVAAFRTLVYLFVVGDLTIFTPWVRGHADVPGSLYQPLFVGRLLHLPTPTYALVWSVFTALVVTAAVAATGRAPRLLGWTVFALYFEWMIIAMSYGKVDHDRFAFLVALAVLPTVGAARHGDRALSERAGWALRVTQIAVVATYFLAAWAKLRFGGIDWMFGSVLMRAIIRRGTWLTDFLTSAPGILIAAQVGIMAFELFSPLIFLTRGRWRTYFVAYFYGFHLVTFATITISFAPHLVAMTSFLPLERVRPIVWARRALGRRPADADAGDAGGVEPGTGRAGGGRRTVGGGGPQPDPLGVGQGAGGGAAGHPVAVAGDEPVDRVGGGQHGPDAQHPAEPRPDPA
ncbi:MFS transporter permease [Luedemannella helvata]|uniref:Vitamin K-dependent gamma-carboxylase n=1 Tax=Luedemannella helvata TaxID=349315 RepID=A0ABP4XJ94_9ACTN